MIIVKLQGGLGNQMFQYALGKHMSILNKTKLFLDIDTFINKPNNQLFTNREFLLSFLNIDGIILNEIHKRKIFNKSIVFGLFFKNKITRSIEKDNTFDETILDLKGNIFLDGYWQNERYFKSIENDLKKDFSYKLQPLGQNKEFLQNITKCNSVAIHVRRGDYINNSIHSKTYKTCSTDYYHEAVNLIKKSTKDELTFFVFSDDIPWAKNNLTFISDKMVFVENNDENSSYEDLRLMQQCKHIITANSTFSWWAAWLNPNPNKIIITPKQWLNDISMENKELIPATWIKI